MLRTLEFLRIQLETHFSSAGGGALRIYADDPGGLRFGRPMVKDLDSFRTSPVHYHRFEGGPAHLRDLPAFRPPRCMGRLGLRSRPARQFGGGLHHNPAVQIFPRKSPSHGYIEAPVWQTSPLPHPTHPFHLNTTPAATIFPKTSHYPKKNPPTLTKQTRLLTSLQEPIPTASSSSYLPLTDPSMSSGNFYAINDFSLYLMPKLAAPACPPCQSAVLRSVFEDDDDDVESDQQEMTVLSKVNKVFRKMIVKLHKPSSPKSFFSSRVRSNTLSTRTCHSPPSSTRSSTSD
ncbi:hypothetical protein PSTG_05546 [Puccinia striiformis f. sp. tritici PST-78]|uniref:Uncharacterized protein n=1 Tax=Puccinia striiformis f. sp. tritici PST-78 TaxID=1165861 RepID=A0A0L0VPJ7_9BASI|nr:hypothetical protein PSTG_05546 [Puccinia striiformis f. sp. tritici PST-78]